MSGSGDGEAFDDAGHGHEADHRQDHPVRAQGHARRSGAN